VPVLVVPDFDPKRQIILATATHTAIGEQIENKVKLAVLISCETNSYPGSNPRKGFSGIAIGFS
jgi:hypothetical protein